MEACATSHFWGRFAQGLGHVVRPIPPIYVKPFVKRQKNDAADAAAIAEAALRPNLPHMAVKSAEHQTRAVAFRTHQSFVGQRTQLINALRGHLADFGLVTAGAIMAFGRIWTPLPAGETSPLGSSWSRDSDRPAARHALDRSVMWQADIRKLVIVDAMSRIRWIVRKRVLPDNWLRRVLGRKPAWWRPFLGQQDGAHDPGDDDAGRELSDGVNRCSLTEGKLGRTVGPGKEID